MSSSLYIPYPFHFSAFYKNRVQFPTTFAFNSINYQQPIR